MLCYLITELGYSEVLGNRNELICLMKSYVPQIKRCSPVEISEEKYSSCVMLSSLRSLPSPWVNTSSPWRPLCYFVTCVYCGFFWYRCLLTFRSYFSSGAKYSLNKCQFTDVYSCNICRNGIQGNVFLFLLQFRTN